MLAVQKRVLEEYLGEQPVGTCILIPTNCVSHPYLAHAPTMRVPQNISGTDNVYIAMWATLTAIHRHNRTEMPRIEVVACPVLGTGPGGVEPIEALLQLLLAYEHFLKPPKFINPTFAQQRHERVHFGGRWGFEHPRPPSK